jgi:Na+-driven multidrug efflux pump
LCVGLILALSLVSVSLNAAIVGAVIGIVISEIVSLFILIIYIKKEKLKQIRKSNLQIEICEK